MGALDGRVTAIESSHSSATPDAIGLAFQIVESSARHVATSSSLGKTAAGSAAEQATYCVWSLGIEAAGVGERLRARGHDRSRTLGTEPTREPVLLRQWRDLIVQRRADCVQVPPVADHQAHELGQPIEARCRSAWPMSVARFSRIGFQDRRGPHSNLANGSSLRSRCQLRFNNLTARRPDRGTWGNQPTPQDS